MANTYHSFTNSLLDDFSFGQASGGVDAQDDATAASKFDSAYIVPRHHSAFQQPFPPHGTWEEPMELSGEAACNTDPFEDIDWYDTSIQALIKEALDMPLPAPSEDITQYCKFALLPSAASKSKISFIHSSFCYLSPSIGSPHTAIHPVTIPRATPLATFVS